MSSLKTSLSVQQIQLALRNSDLFNQRSDIIVPNLSWSVLPYEADLIGISRSGQITEVEIKRSIADLRADYRKGHRHDAGCVTYFYYCVPEKLAEKAEKVILECEQKRYMVPISEKDCPALLLYNEKGKILHTGFGRAKRTGYHETSPSDRENAGRMASLRYWNLLERTIEPEDRGLQKKIRELQNENRALKGTIETIEEDYNMLKRMLRYRYPQLWQEFLDVGHSVTHETSSEKTIDPIDTRKNEFIQKIIRKYGLKDREGVEIKTKAVCTDSTSNPHPGDDLITEILYRDHLIAMIYQRRDGMNWTETNCIDLKPLI